MSRYVYMVCQQCRTPHAREYSDSINHGEEAFREIWQTRKLVAQLAASGAWDFNDVRPSRTCDAGDFFRFISAHSEHPVILKDEYGGVGSIEGTGPCERQP